MHVETFSFSFRSLNHASPEACFMVNIGLFHLENIGNRICMRENTQKEGDPWNNWNKPKSIEVLRSVPNIARQLLNTLT
jgi:hypothetical protein